MRKERVQDGVGVERERKRVQDNKRKKVQIEKKRGRREKGVARLRKREGTRQIEDEKDERVKESREIEGEKKSEMKERGLQFSYIQYLYILLYRLTFIFLIYFLGIHTRETV